MEKLNKDIILLILEELQDDNKTICSCLLVNKDWCETTIPILWKNPTKKDHINDENIFLKVILSHLSEESRNNLKNQGFEFIEESYHQRPLYNYISFWRHLDLNFLECIITNYPNIESNIIYKVGNEILNLFNMNTKFISLSIQNLDRIHITGTESCFSELKYCSCDVKINSNVLESLAIKNTSIKKLIFDINHLKNNPGIIRLIEAQKNLKKVNFGNIYVKIRQDNFFSINKAKEELKDHADLHKGGFITYDTYFKTLEESLIKCADTIQYLKIRWIPITNYLSYLVNLVSLKIQPTHKAHFKHLENLFLPNLKCLKTQYISSKILASLIENTKGQLNKISILFQNTTDNEKLIQIIYKNCPNLSYLQLSLVDSDIPEVEKILIHCQFLIELEIMEFNEFSPFEKDDWNKLFEILLRSSPISLFKFKFFSRNIENKLEILKLFLDSWKDRHPIILQTITLEYELDKLELQVLKDELQMYKVEGIIKNYDFDDNTEGIGRFYRGGESYNMCRLRINW
ncbi:hypothetical protein C1646_758845 [Rhizophagus diaphanus]|nr:hypothetical protein C1646_758845 [Rhizophagus diaphanus] [Rhizophagus sp. MUCL 43196]